MRRSRGFASTAANKRPVETRFRCGSRPEALNRAGDGKSPDHYAKGTQSPVRLAGHRAPTACRRVVSGSVSSPCRGSSHRSLTLLCAIGRQGVLSLAGWSPQIRTHFHVLSRTQDTPRPLHQSRTGLSPGLAGDSTPFRLALGILTGVLQPRGVTPTV
jgi:hypothetical protein